MPAVGSCPTFARFFRHSVQALGVTMPNPLRLFDEGLAAAAAPDAAAEGGPELEGAEGVELACVWPAECAVEESC